MVFIPQAQPHAQSLFLFPIVCSLCFKFCFSFSNTNDPHGDGGWHALFWLFVLLHYIYQSLKVCVGSTRLSAEVERHLLGFVQTMYEVSQRTAASCARCARNAGWKRGRELELRTSFLQIADDYHVSLLPKPSYAMPELFLYM